MRKTEAYIGFMYRILRLLGFFVLCFLLTSGSVLLVIFWDAITERIGPPRSHPNKPRIVSSPSGPAQITPHFVPPEPPRRGRKTWAEAEGTFDDMRAKLDENPGWKDNPSSVYEMVANPA